MDSPRPGRTRPRLLAAGLIFVLGLGTFVALQSPRVRAWFARDGDDPAEVAKLGDARLAVAPPAAADVGWPQWRGPTRDGRAPAGPLRTDWDKRPPTPVWSVPCGGGYSSLAVTGGRVYGQDRTATGERVFCLDAATGALVWSHSYPADYSGFRAGYGGGPRATPTVVGNRVYTVGAVGTFHCLEAPAAAGGSPRVVWQHDLLAEFQATLPTWGVACSPLVDGGLVIVQPGGAGGSVAAFDAEGGERRWAAGANPGGYSSPVAATVGGTRVVHALTGDAYLCVRAADGVVLGQYPWKTDHRGNIATPVAVDDYVFITSAYNKGCALLRLVPAGDRASVQEVYVRSNRVLRAHHASPVYRDGFLYGFDGTRSTTLTCVDFRKGATASAWEESDIRSGSLILAGDHLIVLTESGKLGLVEATPTAFRPVASVPSGLTGSEVWAGPVLVDGRFYLRGPEAVVCLDVRP